MPLQVEHGPGVGPAQADMQGAGEVLVIAIDCCLLPAGEGGGDGNGADEGRLHAVEGLQRIAGVVGGGGDGEIVIAGGGKDLVVGRVLILPRRDTACTDGSEAPVDRRGTQVAQ